MALPVIVLALFGTSVFAQNVPSNGNSANAQRMIQARYGSTPGQRGMYPPAMTKEKIEKFIQSLLEMGLIYKMLEQPTMVSSENGVIVAYGDTLRKYDKDLNVVKEVNLDVNVDGMQELAAKFAKKYSNDLMDLMGGIPGSTSAIPSSSTSATVAYPVKPPVDQREEEIKKEIEQMK